MILLTLSLIFATSLGQSPVVPDSKLCVLEAKAGRVRGHWHLEKVVVKGETLTLEVKVTSTDGNEKGSPGFSGLVKNYFPQHGFYFGVSNKWQPFIINPTLQTQFGDLAGETLNEWAEGKLPKYFVTDPAKADNIGVWQWRWEIKSTCGQAYIDTNIIAMVDRFHWGHPCCIPNGFASMSDDDQKCIDVRYAITESTQCREANPGTATSVPDAGLALPPVAPSLKNNNNCKIVRAPAGFWKMAGSPGAGNTLKISQQAYSTDGNEKRTPDFWLQIKPALENFGFQFGSESSHKDLFPSVSGGGSQTVLDGFGNSIAAYIESWIKDPKLVISHNVGPAAANYVEFWQWVWIIHNTCGQIRYHSPVTVAINRNRVQRPCCRISGFKNPGGKGVLCTDFGSVITHYKECLSPNSVSQVAQPALLGSAEEPDTVTCDAEYRGGDMVGKEIPVYNSDGNDVSVKVNLLVSGYRNTLAVVKNNLGVVVIVIVVAGIIALIAVASKVRKTGYAAIETDRLLSVAA